QDHERRRPRAPALENIRAARFLADRVQGQVVHQARHRKLIEIARDADLEPGGAVAGAAVEREAAHCNLISNSSSASRSSLQRILSYASTNVNQPKSSCSSASMRMLAAACSRAAKPISVAMTGGGNFEER